MRPEQLQLIALIVSPVTMLLVVVLGVFSQNRHVDVRLNDVKELLRAEIRASHAELRAEFGDLRVLLEKNHSEMMARFAELDNRLSRLEGERRIVP